MSRSLLRGKICLIGITGRAGSGKDTLAQALCGKFGYRQYSFAEPIYNMLKTLPYAEHWNGNMARDEKEKVNAFYGKSTRQMLQTLGTEWGRLHVHPNIWVNILQDKLERKHAITGHSKYVINDLRFPNEAELVRDLGGICVRVVRNKESDVPATHQSEFGISNELLDTTINNFTTIEAFTALATNVDDLAEARRTAAAAGK